MTRVFRLACFSGCVLGAWLTAAPLLADPAAFTPPLVPAATAGTLIIDDEDGAVPVSSGTFSGDAAAETGAASPALDLFDPANPDPTYIPPDRRFSAPGEKAQPEGNPALSLPSRLDLPGSMEGFPVTPVTPGTTATGSMGADGKTASASAVAADRAAWPALSPSLIRGADFTAAAKAATEASATATLKGRLIPEEQPLKRRVFYRRWAIQTPAGERYPLASNLALMQAVKQKGILDGQVSITGRWNPAKGEPRLKFFIAEQVRAIEPAAEAAAGNAMATAPAKALSVDVLSAPAAGEPSETASGTNAETASGTASEADPGLASGTSAETVSGAASRAASEATSGTRSRMPSEAAPEAASETDSGTASETASATTPGTTSETAPGTVPLSSVATISPPIPDLRSAPEAPEASEAPVTDAAPTSAIFGEF